MEGKHPSICRSKNIFSGPCTGQPCTNATTEMSIDESLNVWLQNLESRGLIVRNPIMLTAPSTSTACRHTNVIHLARFAPPHKLSSFETFRVSQWGNVGCLLGSEARSSVFSFCWCSEPFASCSFTQLLCCCLWHCDCGFEMATQRKFVSSISHGCPTAVHYWISGA